MSLRTSVKRGAICPILFDCLIAIGAIIVRQLGVVGEIFDSLPQQFTRVVVVGNAFGPRVIQPLWSNVPVQISQDKTKRSGDVSEWFIEQLIEDIIPNVCAHSQTLELVVEERIRRYCAIHVFRAHSCFLLRSERLSVSVLWLRF